MKLIQLALLVNENIPRGEGTNEDPCRLVTQAMTLDGVLVYEYDVHNDKVSMTGNLIDVIRKAPRVTEIIRTN